MIESAWLKLLAEKDARIAELEARIEELLARLGKSSLNSSKAPSSDDASAREQRRARPAKHAKRRAKDARRKNRAKLSALPADAVTSSEEHRPAACQDCGKRFRAADILSEPERIQKLELPDLAPLCHEIRLFSASCRCCGKVTAAERPAEANTTKIGPHLRALITTLLGRYHLSRRDVVEFLADVHGIDISLGLLSKIEAQVADAMEPAYQEAVTATQSAPVVHADETGWSHGGIPGWLWVASVGHVSRFLIDRGRGTAAADQLLGTSNKRTVTVTDRWVAYGRRKRRQLCWAHLERNAQALVDRGSNCARVGSPFVAFVKQMFELWHRFLDKGLSRSSLQAGVRRRWLALRQTLDSETELPPLARTFIKGIDKAAPHLFTFTRVEGVEPTNNLAERELRSAVLWRRSSQASRSDRGHRFVERVLTIVTSLRAQGRNVFAFLRDVLCPARSTPSLLSAAHDV